jgi:hypothetical protein
MQRSNHARKQGSKEAKEQRSIEAMKQRSNEAKMQRSASNCSSLNYKQLSAERHPTQSPKQTPAMLANRQIRFLISKLRYLGFRSLLELENESSLSDVRLSPAFPNFSSLSGLPSLPQLFSTFDRGGLADGSPSYKQYEPRRSSSS